MLYLFTNHTDTRYYTYKKWNDEYPITCKITKKIPIAMALAWIFLLLNPKYSLFRYIAYR